MSSPEDSGQVPSDDSSKREEQIDGVNSPLINDRDVSSGNGEPAQSEEGVEVVGSHDESESIELAPVVITPDLIHRMARSKVSITPHVIFDDGKPQDSSSSELGKRRLHIRTKHSVLERTVTPVLKARTLDKLLLEAARYKERWESSGVFREVGFTLEPFMDGYAKDVLIRFDLTSESKSRQELGIHTTATMVPEIKAQWLNALGRAIDLSLFFTPAPSAMDRSSGNFSLVSWAPWPSSLFLWARRAELYIGRHVETRMTPTRVISVADHDETTSVKIKFDLCGPPQGPTDLTPTTHQITAGVNKVFLRASEASSYPAEDRLELGEHLKCYIRSVLKYSSAKPASHPTFYDRYPFPILGEYAHLATEVAGGSCLPGDAEHLKTELQLFKFFPILPGVSLDISAYLGQVWSWQQLATGATGVPLPLEHVTRGGDTATVRLPDRLFLSWRQLRGFHSTGPANVTADGSPHIGQAAPSAYRALGGNAAWSLGASLNFPFVLWPDNGFFTCHLFANAGQVRSYARGIAEWLADPKDWFRNPACSIGGGLVLTKLPMFSALHAGRFELNWSIPLQVLPDGKVKFEAMNPRLFKSFRWGLHWTNLSHEN